VHEGGCESWNSGWDTSGQLVLKNLQKTIDTIYYLRYNKGVKKVGEKYDIQRLLNYTPKEIP